MKIIETNQFKKVLLDICNYSESRRFCFVIGAGASKTGGIPTGAELSKRWFKEIKERENNEHDFTKWVNKQTINENDLASSYGTIYRKRFEFDKKTGYEYLVHEMKDCSPSLGHYFLAQILSEYGHCVLTTNFDSLIESSIYQFTDKTPLVCGHESLSSFARPSKIHPLVIKIHRDLLLDPKSDPDEINELANGWNEPLDFIFNNHIPIIVGYGGNDGSLMKYFQNMSKPSNFFWCGLDSNNLTESVKNLIIKHDGSFVNITDFDELMFELTYVFDKIQFNENILRDITEQRIKKFKNQVKQLDLLNQEQIESSIFETPKDSNLELSAFEYSFIAEQEFDLERRKKIYLKALKIYPTTGWLWYRLSYLMHFVKKDYSELENYYSKALEFNDGLKGLYGNYAIFLQEVKRDYDRAEEFYLKEFSYNEGNCNDFNNYAIFLQTIRLNYNEAEKYFLIALDLDSENINANISYAEFQLFIKKDYTKAYKYFSKAFNLEPYNIKTIIGLGVYYINLKGGYLKAEEYFLKALAKEPSSLEANIYYGLLLKVIKNDSETAKKYYLNALSIDGNNPFSNANYAQILLESGKTDEAEPFIKKAFEQNVENNLQLELWFYRYAHYPKFHELAKIKIEQLLDKGIRTSLWSFKGNIARAESDNHPNLQKLKELAIRISEDSLNVNI